MEGAGWRQRSDYECGSGGTLFLAPAMVALSGRAAATASQAVQQRPSCGRRCFVTELMGVMTCKGSGRLYRPERADIHESILELKWAPRACYLLCGRQKHDLSDVLLA